VWRVLEHQWDETDETDVFGGAEHQLDEIDKTAVLGGGCGGVEHQ